MIFKFKQMSIFSTKTFEVITVCWLQVFRRHLATLFMYDFPQHYGEVLSLALRHSETQSLATDTWYDLVNALAQARCRPGLNMAQLKETINKYATEQRALSLQEVSPLYPLCEPV